MNWISYLTILTLEYRNVNADQIKSLVNSTFNTDIISYIWLKFVTPQFVAQWVLEVTNITWRLHASHCKAEVWAEAWEQHVHHLQSRQALTEGLTHFTGIPPRVAHIIKPPPQIHLKYPRPVYRTNTAQLS